MARRRLTWLGEALGLTAVTFVGALLRFVRLDLAPPGLYHDEAIYGILGLYVMHGNRDLFFGEREGLFMYLLAEGVKLLGHDVTTLRIVAATVGTLAIPALYILARLMYDRQVAILAAIGLSASYWHVTLSRDIFRAGTLPLFETVALALLWAALRAQRIWLRLPLFLAAGGALGLVLYTYIAGRMVPVLVTIFLLTELWRGRSALRPAWASVPGYFAAAALVFAPLGSFFLTHPESFLGRLREVSVAAGSQSESIGYLDNALRVLGMFAFAGDQNWRHNLAGKPVFDPLFFLAFLAGVLLCLRGWRLAEHRFTLLWLGLMLLPTLAAEDAPHYLRANGALPALYLLTALGWAAGWAWLAPRLAKWATWSKRLAGSWGFAGLCAVLVAWPAASSAWTYCNLWLPRAETYAAFNGRLADTGRYLAASAEWQQSSTGQRDFFLTDRFWQDNPSVLWYIWPLLSGKERTMADSRLGTPWFDEEEALALRPQGGHYLLSSEDAWALAELRRQYPPERLTLDEQPSSPEGRPPFLVAHAAGPSKVETGGAPLSSFGGALELLGVRLPDAVASGGQAEIVTTWRLRQPPETWLAGDTRMTVFVHALDVDGSLLAGANGLGYLPVDWHGDETLLLRHTLQLPPGTAPGEYQVTLGVLGPDGQRLADSRGSRPDNTYLLANPMRVAGQTNPGALPASGIAQTWQSGAGFSLLGLDLPTGEVTAGQSLRTTLYWQARQDVRAEHRLALVLLDASGQVVARDAGQPAFGRYPTSSWRAGETVRDPRQVQVGARTREGVYTLALDPGALGGGYQALARLRVKEPARSFAQPQPGHPLASPPKVGEIARLIGYDLDTGKARPGGELQLTLYWQAGAETERHYKVFAHLVAPQGGAAAQSDAEPAGWQRPLPTWVEGEIIADTHLIALPGSLPPGQYELVVGFYDVQDGNRLPVFGADGQQVGTSVQLTAVSLTK
ncbi:MAG: phospholipid carrier-dependent glycosyltransferase [Chloroflexota bacterium]